MSDIICRQCGQRYSRTDFPAGQFHCSWCNWKEMLPAAARGISMKDTTATQDEVEATDGPEAVAVAENEQVETAPAERRPEPKKTVSDEAATAEWGLVVQSSPQDFTDWCGRLAMMFGFTIVEPDDPQEKDCDFQLVRKGETRFVDCRHFPDGDTVPRREVQKLAGAMMGRQITKGMFMTTGTFDESCRAFVASLPNLTIELIDGADLQETLRVILCGPLRNWWK